MKMTQRHDVWDRRTRWKSGYSKAPNIQDNFHHLETLKVSSPSVPCLGMTGKKSSWGALTNKGKDLNSKPRKVLMPITKGNAGRTLAKSNSLPPIYSPKTCLPSLVVGYQEQKLEKKAVRMDKVVFDRQKQGCQLFATSQLIYSTSRVFIEKESDPIQRMDNLKTPVTLVKGELNLELSNLSANDRERTEDSSSVSKGRCAQTLSDSAIEMDSLSSLKKENDEEKTRMTDVEEEEEYYTDQRITAWIVKVNASLFSSSKEEIETDHALEEQDVDTIKIIYGQD